MLRNHDTGGEAEVLPAHMQVLHYRVDVQVLLLQSPPTTGALPFSSSKPQQTHLPMPAADPVGMLQSVVGDEEAQGRTKTPFPPDTKSVPATYLNTEAAA